MPANQSEIQRETTHTPGPWRTVNLTGEFIGIEAADGYPVARTVIESANLRRVGRRASVPGENQANARLIAAAPSLLEACQRVLAWADRNNTQPRWLYDVLRSAIDKARGGDA